MITNFVLYVGENQIFHAGNLSDLENPVVRGYYNRRVDAFTDARTLIEQNVSTCVCLQGFVLQNGELKLIMPGDGRNIMDITEMEKSGGDGGFSGTETDPIYRADKPSIVFNADLNTHNTSNASHTDIRTLVNNLDFVKSVSKNDVNGDVTFTFRDNSTLTMNIFVANLAKDIDYDSDTKEIVITKQNGDVIRISVVDLIDVYLGSNGTHIQVTIGPNNTINAVLKAGTVTANELSQALLELINSKVTAAFVNGVIDGHNEDIEAHGINQIKGNIQEIQSDIKDIQGEIEDLQQNGDGNTENNSSDDMRGIAQYKIGSEITLSKEVDGSDPITNSSDIEQSLSLFAQGDWEDWLEESKAKVNDFVYSEIYNWMLEIIEIEPHLIFKALPMNPSGEGSDNNSNNGSVDWSSIQNKPNDFIPSLHKHVVADITDLEPIDLDEFLTKEELSKEIQNRIDADNSLSERIDEAKAIAEGRASARVFTDIEELDAWLLILENVDLLNIGDHFLIIDLNVPDFWWDGTQKRQLETEKVDLTEYYTKTQIDNLLSSKVDLTTFNTQLASKLDKTETAADSAKLGGQLPSYYATADELRNIQSNEYFTGTLLGPSSAQGNQTISIDWQNMDTPLRDHETFAISINKNGPYQQAAGVIICSSADADIQGAAGVAPLVATFYPNTFKQLNITVPTFHTGDRRIQFQFNYIINDWGDASTLFFSVCRFK
jgi:hypothetical protein